MNIAVIHRQSAFNIENIIYPGELNTHREVTDAFLDKWVEMKLIFSQISVDHAVIRLIMHTLLPQSMNVCLLQTVHNLRFVIDRSQDSHVTIWPFSVITNPVMIEDQVRGDYKATKSGKFFNLARWTQFVIYDKGACILESGKTVKNTHITFPLGSPSSLRSGLSQQITKSSCFLHNAFKKYMVTSYHEYINARRTPCIGT